MNVQLISVSQLVRDPNNPRKTFDPASIKALGESLKRRVLVPLIVLKVVDTYQIVDGHRRWEGAKLAGLEHLPCEVLLSRPEPAEILALQLILLCHREDLRPVERAESYLSLMRMKQWRANELAAELGISNAAVTRALALLVDSAIKQAVQEGKLSDSSAYAITRLPKDQWAANLAQAIQGEVSRDELNARAKKQRRDTSGKRPARIVYELLAGTLTLEVPSPLSMEIVLKALTEAVKECRRGVSQGLDATTLARVLHDRAKARGTAN